MKNHDHDPVPSSSRRGAIAATPIALLVAALSVACSPSAPHTLEPGGTERDRATAPRAPRAAPGSGATSPEVAAEPAGTASISAAAAPAPAAAAPPDRWWCMSVLDQDWGDCYRTRQACETVHQSRRQKYRITDCAPQQAAACFDAERDGKTVMVCQPTFAICRSRRDERDLRPLSDCRALLLSMKPAGPDAPLEDREDPRWWCVSFDHPTLGACRRSRRACEADRKLALEKHAQPVSDCTPQGKATCLRYKDASGRANRQCHPTPAMCKVNLDFYRQDGLPGAQVISDCGAVE